MIADGPIAAAALRGLSRRRPVVYNAHNLESGFRGDLREGGGSLRALRRFERGVLARASESWMVSEAELAAAAELCPRARLRYVPNVVDVAAIAPVTELADEQRALFVANFAYEPNRNGLRFLLERVMPLAWERLPQARLMLVGPGLDAPPSRDPRIEAAGFVDELADAYRRSRCALVPLLQGGGTPLKFVEALAYGVPVLATPRAAAGLGVTRRQGLRARRRRARFRGRFGGPARERRRSRSAPADARSRPSATRSRRSRACSRPSSPPGSGQRRRARSPPLRHGSNGARRGGFRSLLGLRSPASAAR